MSKLLRVSAMLLSVLTIFALFNACGKKTEGNTQTTDGISAADVHFIDEDGEPTYIIIRPDNNSEAPAKVAQLVFEKYRDQFDAKARRTVDSEDENKPEIIIGATNRPETEMAKELLAENTDGRDSCYIICTVNDSIVIYGKSDSALLEAGNYFVENYMTNATVTGGINYTYQKTDSVDITLMGTTRLDKFSVVRPIYNVSYVVQCEIDKLVEHVKNTTDYSLPVINDQYATVTGNSLDGSSELKPTEQSEYEIVVGGCVRDGVKTINNRDEYEIRVDGNKIFLNGGSPKAVAMAVTEFVDIIKSNSAFSAENDVTSGNYNDVISKYDSASYYRLTWADDFDGTEFNEQNWHVAWGESAYTPPEGGKPTYRGNKQLKNNYVKDGKMYFDAIETDTGYYGGLIHSQGRVEYWYGYIEISTLHPRVDGVWTALYTMSDTNDPGGNVWQWLYPDPSSRFYYNETDVEEATGAGNWVWQHTHTWPTAYAKQILGDSAKHIHLQNTYRSLDDRGFWMDFHTYGFELLSNKEITYTCDGIAWYTEELDSPERQQAYDQPVFMRLGMAVGTANYALSTNPEDWQNYNHYMADYIHIYQRKGHKLYTKDYSATNWNVDTVE